MIPLSDSEIELAARHLNLTDLTVSVRREWGAENPDHRPRIHGALEAFRAATPDLLTSISHAPGLGGWAAARTFKQVLAGAGAPPRGLGFDLEKSARVTEALVRRVCRVPGEFEQAPSPAALWTAKEAAYKSLRGPDQPTLASEIEIVSWGTLSRFETFTASFRRNPTGLKIRGVSWSQDEYRLSLAVFEP